MNHLAQDYLTAMGAAEPAGQSSSAGSKENGHHMPGNPAGAFLPLPPGVSSGEMAVLMSDLILSPQFPEIAEEIMADPGWRKRYDTDAGRQLAETNQRMMAFWERDNSADGVRLASMPEWVMQSATSAFVGWLSGEARMCLHSPRPDSGQPAFAAAWAPGFIVCPQCTHLQEPEGDDQFRCDLCGQVSHPRDGGGVHPLPINLGALWFQAGICVDCMSTETVSRGKDSAEGRKP